MRIASVVFCVAIVAISGCDGAKNITVPKNSAGTSSVQLPAFDENTPFLTKITKDDVSSPVEIKEKMFIAQVNDVYLNPEDYLGRTIKLEGVFVFEQYAGNENPYCFVIRYGPGCCGNDGNAGFEVAWDAPPEEEKTYPEPNAWVEATGMLTTYEEDGYPYLYLSLASLNVLDTRGAEFVSQ